MEVISKIVTGTCSSTPLNGHARNHNSRENTARSAVLCSLKTKFLLDSFVLPRVYHNEGVLFATGDI